MPLISGLTSAIMSAQAQKNANDTNLAIAKMTNEFNSAEAQKQREWQTEMSNTEVSRRMADLKNAGINPLLAVDSGSAGASTPSGSAASGTAAHMVAPKYDFNAVTSGLSNLATSAVALHTLKKLGNAQDLASVVNLAASAKKASTLAKIVAAIL